MFSKITKCFLFIAVTLLISNAWAAPDVLVQKESVWKYQDDGSNQGNAWFHPGYDDSSWKAGAAGFGFGKAQIRTAINFGLDPNRKQITTYFRQKFQATNPQSYTSLQLSLPTDGGYVVYINGNEVYRRNLLAGPVNYSTTASPGMAESENVIVGPSGVRIDPSVLLEGENLLAVEAHLGSADQAEMEFDAQLIAASVPIITRGPYLQLHRPRTTTIRYTTDVACDAVIRYGQNVNNLSSSVTDPNPTTNHVIKINNLSTGVPYFYSIETTSQQILAKGSGYKFLTSPDDHHQGALQRYWVLGDSGTGDANARAVRDAYINYIGTNLTGLIFMLGNNAMPSGTEANHDTGLFQQFPTLLRQAGLLPTLGEADTDGSTSPPSNIPYFNIFNLPTGTEGGGKASGTEKYFSYNYGIVKFICLDSQASDRSPTGPMMTWLKNELATNTYPWLIAYFHHSPYSKGNHDSDSEQQMAEMRANALPILESNGVDLVLSAHSNSYERSKFLNGHYGLSNTLTSGMIINGGDGVPGSEGGDGVYNKPAAAKNAGTVYVVVGSSGKVESAPLNHPAMRTSLAQLGSLAIDMKNNRLNAKFVKSDGTIGDYFVIVKNNIKPTVTITSPSNGAVFTRPVTIPINATVTDPDTSIRWVEFYKGTSIMFRDWGAPYTYNWTPQFKGTFQLKVKAMDELGANTTSNTITVTVN